MNIKVIGEFETFSLAKKVASNIKGSLNIYLNGSLGAGKTTFAKGLIRHAGYKGLINSPTFSIIKEYSKLLIPIYHFDLYRIKNSYEMKTFGLNDYLLKPGIILIEWAEKGKNKIPESDLIINFFQEKNYRIILLYANTQKGKKIIFNLI